MGILVGFEGKSHGSGKEKAWVGRDWQIAFMVKEFVRVIVF